MERTVMHIDMNAFFASVEQRSNPALRGKPVAVIGSDGRTVVTTASYEARALGVKTGMNRFEAKRACPELILVVGNNRKYTDTSIRIIAIFEDFTPEVEVFSIDEAFLDVTASLPLWSGPEDIARSIKRRIKDEIGITCSVGIAPNKLVAKLASGMEKPDGLVRIRPEEVAGILDDMPAGKLCGIGPRLFYHLEGMGVTTCGELSRYPVGLLRRRFGIVGERLSLMARGIDTSPVVASGDDKEPKSVGHSTTLRKDVPDGPELRRYILKLSEMVARRARRYGIKGARVTLTIRYADFYTFTRQRSLPEHTDDSRVIARAAKVILRGLRITNMVRLVGVSISKLVKGPAQLSLFDADLRREALLQVVDSVNDRFGDFTLTWAELMDGKSEKGVISPSWRPAGVKNIDVK